MKTVSVTIKVEEFEDEHAARRLVNADNAYTALADIRDQIFRPARKHGYANGARQDLFNDLGEKAYDLASSLEDLFVEILQNNGIDLEDA